MKTLINTIQSFLPDRLDAGQIGRFTAIFVVGILLLGLLGRFAFGKRSALNHSVSSAISILFMYAIFVVVAIFVQPLSAYLSPLPFIDMDSDFLYIFPIFSSGYQEICYHILGTLILSFLLNLLDSYLPEAKKLFSWFFRNISILILGFVLHGLATYLLNRFLPEVLLIWAPVILLGVLVFLLVLSFLKVLFGVAMAAVNPLIAAVYTFFFANKIGKLFSKAIFTTILLTLIVAVMNWTGFTTLSIAVAALTAYIPFLIILLFLWYLLGKVL